MKKKKSPSAKISNPKSKNEKLNPFEVHINHSKHKILGQKSKDDHGLPGVSRGKAYKKREKTLLGEYKDRFKDRKFLDKRIGEKNKFLDPEKKIMMRLAAEKRKEFSKKSMYNLNDDEYLMHDGELLTEATMKDKKDFSDDDDYDDTLDASFVKEKHFGGGLFTKPGSEDSQAPGSEGKSKSRKEWIEDIIAESKKKKAESKREKDAQTDAVSKLDTQFQTFLSLMKGKTLTEEDKEKSKKTCPFRDYDKYVTELGFDRSRRARPTDRIKTEEEIAREEQQRLQTLEDDRLRRMRSTNSQYYSSRSADALDDGFELAPKVSLYEPFKPSSTSQSKISLRKNEDKEHSESDSAEEEGEDEEEEEEDEDDEKEEDSDNYSDVLDASEDESESASNTLEKSESKTEKSEHEVKKSEDKSVNPDSLELPFTFEVPGDYDGFWDLLRDRSAADVSTIMERMIACNHPSLGGENKGKINFVFAYILQTLHSLSGADADWLCVQIHPLEYIDSLIPHLYTIAQLNPVDSASALNQVIDEKYEEFNGDPTRKYPFGDTFIFLKISGLLFPASDFHHDVMTRVMTFLTQILGEAKINSGRDCIGVIFTCSLLFEYLNRSGRFVGELVNSLCGLLFSSIPPSPQKRTLPHYPPFRTLGPSSDLLVLQNPIKKYSEPNLTFALLNREPNLTDHFKVKILNETLKLARKICQKWTHLPAIRSIFLPVVTLVDQMPLLSYPEETGSLVQELRDVLSTLPGQVAPLKKIEDQIKTLKMVEPSIEKVIDGVKKRGGNRELQERQKLIHKLKRERKGAKRELKRDGQFLARQQLKEAIESDRERKKKVNMIMQDLATQESEYKKFKSQ